MYLKLPKKSATLKGCPTIIFVGQGFQPCKNAFIIYAKKTFLIIPVVTYSPGCGLAPSTIGPGGLNCCVRNGNRCCPTGKTTEKLNSTNDCFIKSKRQENQVKS